MPPFGIIHATTKTVWLAENAGMDSAAEASDERALPCSRGGSEEAEGGVPLKKGKGKKVVSQNIREFHTGKTYARTRAKFGKRRADKQAVAAALETQRRSREHDSIHR